MQPLYTNFRLTFLYAEKYAFSRKWLYPESVTPYCMYRYIISGCAVFSINGTDYTVEKDDIFFIPQGCKLSCQALTEIEFISIRFVGSAQIDHTDLMQQLFNIPYLTKNDSCDIKACFEKVHKSALSKKNYKMFSIRGNLDLISYYLAKKADNKSEDDNENEPETTVENSMSLAQLQKRAEKSAITSDPRITAVIDYLTASPSNNISIYELSRKSDMSESSFRRLFKQQTGKSPSQFITDLKMMESARKLLISDARISAIAYELGFDSPNYFARQFRYIFGVSPSEYRKNSQGL